MTQAHQPGSKPLDIPERFPNPIHQPIKRPTEPVREKPKPVPEKEPA